MMCFAGVEATPFGWPEALVAVAALLLGWTLLMTALLFFAAVTLGPEAVVRILRAAHGSQK